SVPASYMASVPLSGLAVLALVLGIVLGWTPLTVIGLLAAAGVLVLNRSFLGAIRRSDGWGRALAALPLLWLAVLVGGVGGGRGVALLPVGPPILTIRDLKETTMGYLDYLQHGTKMFRKKGELPVYLVYFITDACNAKCKHCLLADGAHPGWEGPSVTYRKQELSLEEIEKVTTSIGKGS